MIGLEGQHEKKFRHLFKLIHPDDRSKFKRELKKLIEGKIDQFNCETRTRHSQGHYIWLHNRANVTDRDLRGACRIIGTSVDIQNRKTGEVAIYDLCQQLQSSETHYRELMKNANDAILISDMDNNLRIIDTNHQASQLSGYSQEELLQKRYNELIPNPAGDCLQCNGGVHRNIVLIDKDGRQHTIDVSCTRIDLSGRRLRQCIIHDISERKATEERLHHLAHHDPLTGLPNRTLFRDRLQQAILKANRHNTLVALCYFDLNNFKQINDTMGHDTGDQVLTGIARRLKQVIRTSDTAARFGGDEFIIILEELETPAVIKTIAAKILEQLNRPMQTDKHTLQITSSMGISIYPETSRDLDTLLSQADTAMYKAKAAGNSLEVFDHDQP